MECQVIRMRGGKPGGGKGPLIGDNMSHTLATNNDQTLICYENHPADSRVKDCGEICPTLPSRAGTGGGNLPLVQTFTMTFCDANGRRKDRPNGGLYVNESDTAKTLATSAPIETVVVAPAISIAENIIGRQDHTGGNGPGFQKEVSYTLNTVGVHGDAMQSSVRRLTTVECARLQAFPDHHTEIPWRGKPKELCPDGPQYKAYGNSMCTNVIKWIGKQIEKELNGK